MMQYTGLSRTPPRGDAPVLLNRLPTLMLARRIARLAPTARARHAGVAVLAAVLLLFAGHPGLAAAQEQVDVIYLENGYVARGIIIEMVPGEYVVLRDNQGEEYRYSYHIIENIEEGGASAGSATQEGSTARDRSYRSAIMQESSGHVALLGGFGTDGRVRFGGGIQTGLTTETGLYVGSQLIRFSGSRGDSFFDNLETEFETATYLGLDVGYAAPVGPVVIQPYLSSGSLWWKGRIPSRGVYTSRGTYSSRAWYLLPSLSVFYQISEIRIGPTVRYRYGFHDQDNNSQGLGLYLSVGYAF